MLLWMQSVLYVDIMLKLKKPSTSAGFVTLVLLKDSRSSSTKKQVIILLYGYPLNKYNTLNQDLNLLSNKKH